MSDLALLYAPDGFDPKARLMGRQVAGAALLKALARHWPTPGLTAVGSPEAAQQLGERLKQWSGRPWTVTAAAPGQAGPLTAAGTFYRPDPVLADEAYVRATGDPRAWSIVGITHTLSSLAAERAIATLPVSAVEPWDALICTSAAVRAVALGLMERHADWQAARTGARFRLPPCEMPVIPLGVHPDEFETTSPAQQAARVRRRAALNIAPDVTVALFVGRLVYHAKANPYPLFTALEEAARRGARIALVMAGWSPSEAIQAVFTEAARALCPSVPVHFLDGRDPAVQRECWAVGDLFVSLVDNIQETFGLTPVEAMAAGLPVVVSDWDGYRDTVQEGVVGFRIPTVAPPPGAGAQLASRHARGLDSYDRYLGAVSQSVSVDAACASDRLFTLAQNPALRRQMGDAGRAVVASTYDWAVVLRQYAALFAELRQIRAAAGAPRTQGHPIHGDPFTTYAGYPTAHLGPQTRVVAAPGLRFADWRRVLGLRLLAIAPEQLLPLARLERLHALLFAGPASVEVLLGALGDPQDPAGLRTLVHLSKAGLVALDGVLAVQGGEVARDG